jgi:hypothetical protein
MLQKLRQQRFALGWDDSEDKGEDHSDDAAVGGEVRSRFGVRFDEVQGEVAQGEDHEDDEQIYQQLLQQRQLADQAEQEQQQLLEQQQQQQQQDNNELGLAAAGDGDGDVAEQQPAKSSR